MSNPTVGDTAPDFTLAGTNGAFHLADHRGQTVVLVFYPGDDTKVCTKQLCEYTDRWDDLSGLDATIVGISRDSCTSHQKFRTKENLNYELLSDEEESLCKLFDVIREKNMYGKKVFGIERSTFLIDSEGKLAAEWRKVKAEGHAQVVLAAAKAL
jgi:peroxiredoxin Q/BCP